MKIYIYSLKDSARLRYITQLLIDDLIGVNSEIITDINEVYTKEFVINYSSQENVGLQIFPDKLLFEKKIGELNLKSGNHRDFVTLFHHDKSIIPFDVFSAAFYLVSRYEEYLPHKRDVHDRFQPEQSTAFKLGFLDQPIVNIWAEYLKNELKEKYPNLKFKYKKFEYINTIDVDYAYAYKEKGAVRSSASLLRDLVTGKWGEFKNRTEALLGVSEDPFDTFQKVLDLHKMYNLKSVFFFHVGDYSENDKSIPIGSNRLQALIKGVNDYADVGLHPSYAAGKNLDKIQVELSRLNKVVHQPVTKSRFHFIKLNLPQSYRALIELDVKEDYTMGYASKMGFRAGICSPFNFFDLDFDASTQLRVYPFYLMEATVKYYFKEGPEKAVNYFKEYIDKVKTYNGTFVSLWHNDSLSEWGQWQNWSRVYVEMIEYVAAVAEKANE